MGFSRAREFYSPKYFPDNPATKTPDLRSAIYWNPEIQTDNNGNASFAWYNGDVPGKYRIVIEGIDDKGNLGSTAYSYKVE